MSLIRIKEVFLRLPPRTKLVGVSALLLGISVFLPWYQDTDSFHTGDRFLGVTGPTSFMGMSIFALALVSLWLFTYHLLERRAPRLAFSESIFHIFAAGESIFLLFLVNSVYFDQSFGSNITLKESGFGMAIAMISAFALLTGGYLQYRSEARDENDEGRLEPLIKIESAPRQEVMEERKRPEAPLEKKSFVFGDAPRPESTLGVRAGAPQPPQEKPKSKSGSYMFRLDL